jgi:hypothetical protein
VMLLLSLGARGHGSRRPTCAVGAISSSVRLVKPRANSAKDRQRRSVRHSCPSRSETSRCPRSSVNWGGTASQSAASFRS